MMRRNGWRVLASTLLAMGCNGTSTGNPVRGTGDPGEGGIEVLKSELPRETAPVVSEDDAAALGRGNREFAFALYGALAEPTENLFFSPFSISVALGMTYPGAEGETEAQIKGALRFHVPEPALHAAFNKTLFELEGRVDEVQPAEGSSVESVEGDGKGFELRLVNQAWGQQGYPFLPTYLDVLASNYGAGLNAVNFGESEPTRELINGWVQEQTEERVKNLLPEGALTVDTRLVLTNAIYFKANWLNPFDVDDTRDGVFHAQAGDRPVRMMNQKSRALFAEFPDYRAVELPYLSQAVRMLLIVPEHGRFEAVVSALGESSFAELRGALSEYEVTLGLPKFGFEFERRLKEPLSALGMPIAFSGESADFTGIAGGVEPLWIDEVYHKAFVAVDEKGTEAAAATAVVVTTESAPPTTELVIDRPFLFAIYDEPTGQILFLGQLVDPG